MGNGLSFGVYIFLFNCNFNFNFNFKMQKCHLGTDYPVQCYKPLTLYSQLCETIF